MTLIFPKWAVVAIVQAKLLASIRIFVQIY